MFPLLQNGKILRVSLYNRKACRYNCFLCIHEVKIISLNTFSHRHTVHYKRYQVKWTVMLIESRSSRIYSSQKRKYIDIKKDFRSPSTGYFNHIASYGRVQNSRLRMFCTYICHEKNRAKDYQSALNLHILVFLLQYEGRNNLPLL